MIPPYRVSTVCIGQNMTDIAVRRYNGMECVVVGRYRQRRAQHRVTGQLEDLTAYVVRWANGDRTLACNAMLRPKFIRPNSGEGKIFALFNF